MIEAVFELVEEVRREHAPDARTAVFEVDVRREESGLVIYGNSSVPAAVEALHVGIAKLDVGMAIRDDVERLPFEGAAVSPHAVVTSATAPMLAGPLISESHLSQMVLGHRTLVLREHGRWLQCRSVDGYIGWVHRGYVRRLPEVEARAWDLGAGGPLHISLGVEVLDDSNEIVARVPWGARVALEGGVVTLPDGTVGPFRGPLVPAAERATRYPTDADALIRTASRWRGTPYLWGGITTWGADCSGLVQSVYRMHGVELPRDSDQQAQMGEEVSTEEDFRLVEPGDLLFFAERMDRISHVAISLGRGGILHSAVGNGGVSTNDLLGESGYERELRELLVTVRRVMNLER